MSDVTVTNLETFTTRLWSFDLGFLQSHFQSWQELILRWREVEPTPAGRSNRSGWNSNKRVLEMNEFAPFLSTVQECFRHAVQEMKLSESVTFRLEAWINVHDHGGFNTLHVHPNALLCGSFYLAVPEGAGPIVFRDPRAGALLFPHSGSGANSGGQFNVQPKVGQLLLFPSWLDHRVEPNESIQPRISIGLNAFTLQKA